MKNKIAIIVDNPLRDLPGCVLLGTALASKNYEVYLVPHNLVFRNNFSELLSMRPDFVILNYLRKNNDHVASALIKCNIPFSVLDTEGGVLAHESSFLETVTENKEIRDKVVFFFSWGKKLADFLVKNDYYSKQQMKVTGSPRYDFYSSLWNNNFDKEVNNLKPYVLINTNFTLINPAFLSPKQEVEMYVKSFNYPREQVLEWQNINKVGMLEIINIAKSISINFPEINIVLRPHPFEKIDTYTEALKGYTNVHVIKKGTVVEWIRNAKAVIQRNCSTSIESGFLGVPALSPHYIPIFRTLPTSEAVSVKCENIDEIQNKIQLILNGRFEIPKKITNELQTIEKDWFYKIDGKAHKRIADAIDGYLRNNNNSVNEKEIKRVLKNHPKLSKKHILKQTLKNFLNGRFKLYSGKQKLEKDFENYLIEWDESDKMFNVDSVDMVLEQVKQSVKDNGLIQDIEKIRVFKSNINNRETNLRRVTVLKKEKYI